MSNYGIVSYAFTCAYSEQPFKISSLSVTMKILKSENFSMVNSTKKDH